MCRTLSIDYDVHLIAVHPQKETKDGVKITPFKRYHNRKFRIAFGWILMFFKALKVNARIYHLHDPELIPCGLLLRFMGKKIILDIHENIAEDIFDKPWIKHQKRAYMIFHQFEKLACRFFTILLAEQSYEKRYKTLGARYTVVQNFCDTKFFEPFRSEAAGAELNLFYIGIVLENRGILQIAEAIYLLKKEGQQAHFHCVGELYSDLEKKLKALSYYSEIQDNMHFYGRLPLEKGYEMVRKMNIGLCIIWPMHNSVDSYPTKLFEYMSCGLPIITSNFKLYRSVVEENGCGICVDPLNPLELKNAVLEIHRDVKKSELMGENGKKAVSEKYIWESQIPLLSGVYSRLSGQKE
jgi:glycosyltransferase involved in cell wall biosynthesis